MNKDYSNVSNIRLEDTGLFNYKGGQCSVYNRLIFSKIRTLKDLFEADDLNKIEYGNDKVGQNFYIHAELKGIIKLLRYKYLNEKSDELINSLNYRPVNNLVLHLNQIDYEHPGYVFDYVVRHHVKVNSIYEFYKILKQCGFDQFCTKAIIELIYMKQLNQDSLNSFQLVKIPDATLGELLSQIELEDVKKIFSKIPNEYPVFINILNTLLEYYKNYNLQDIHAVKK